MLFDLNNVTSDYQNGIAFNMFKPSDSEITEEKY